MREDEVVKLILQTADKHPNARVSKLIREVQEHPTQRNVVLLLIELAEHAEYATDFNISLGYYLDLFHKLGIGQDIVLNEAGLLLLNSSKVYARRVDYIHELVERQILTISSADKDATKNQENAETADKTAKEPATAVKRARKRLVAAVCDPFDVELVPKKFRKLDNAKRFATSAKPKPKTQACHVLPNMDTDQHLHPTCWQHSRIVDLENEDNVDSKRHYKLFTYHVEHRYNTIVPDINFRLHFKVKDYLECEDEADDDRNRERKEVWPPLSDEYVQRYLRLENHVLQQEDDATPPCSKRRRLDRTTTADDTSDELPVNSNNESVQNANTESAFLDKVQNSNLNEMINTSRDSAPDNSLLGSSNTNDNVSTALEATPSDGEATHHDESAANDTTLEGDTALNDTTLDGDSEPNKAAANSTTLEGDSALGSSALTDESMLGQTASQETTSTECWKGALNLNGVRVHLPHLDDEGVFLSDLDDNDVRMLSPKVIATDVFPSMPNKENLTIIVDDEIKAMLDINDEELETSNLPASVKKVPPAPLVLNVMRIHEKFLLRRVLFKLGPEFDLFKQSRSLKRGRCADAPQTRQFKMQLFSLNNTDMEGVPMTPPRSPGQSSDGFLGFSDKEGDEGSQDFFGFEELDDSAESTDKQARLSRDSGVGTEAVSNNLNKNTEETNCAIEKAAESTEKEPETNSADTVTEDMPISSSEETDENLNDSGLPTEDELRAQDPDICEDSVQAQLNESLDLDELGTIQEKTKVQLWHERLQPTLAKARERHHFDIFQIGTEIINQFSGGEEATDDVPSTSKTKRNYTTFQDVMENKDPTYMSRYFLSTLLLANQGNIRINVQNRSSEEPSDWGDIQLDLVSTKRHTVALEDNIGIIAHSSSSQRCAPRQIASTISSPESPALKMKTKSRNSMQTSTPAQPLATPPPLVPFSKTPIQCKLKGGGGGGSGSSSGSSSCSGSVSGKQPHISSKVLNFNLNHVQPLKPIEKVPHVNDDSDSGIFSREDFSL